MGADASIYNMIRPPAAPSPRQSPVEEMGALMQLRAMGDASQLHQMQRTQLQRTMNEDEQTSQAWRDSGGSMDKLRGMLAERGLHKQGQALEKTILDRSTGEANLAAKKMETLAKAAGLLKERLPTVRDDASFQAYRETALQMLGPDMVGKLNLPGAFDPNWVKTQLVKAEELFTPKPQTINLGGKEIVVDMNPWTNPKIVGSEYAKSLTPGEVQTGQHQQATLAETRRYHGVTETQAAATAGVPAGYQRTPDGKGLAPIPGGPADQPTATQKDELTSIARTAATATRLKGMFKPEFVGFKGTMGELMDKYGSQVVPGIDGDQERIQFRSLAADLENQYIKAISGATVPTSEVPRLRRAIPTPADSPVQYQAKLAEMEKNLTDLPNVIRNGAKPGQPEPAKPDPAKATTFTAMPDPSRYNGRRIKADDGTIYKSDGKAWKRLGD